jgi:hypothetical protein
LGVVEPLRKGTDDYHEADADRETERGKRRAPRSATKLGK